MWTAALSPLLMFLSNGKVLIVSSWGRRGGQL